MLDFNLPSFHFGELLALVASALVLWSAMALILAGVLMWLWNWTLPELFRAPRLQFWQSFRLLVIAWIVFGGISN